MLHSILLPHSCSSLSHSNQVSRQPTPAGCSLKDNFINLAQFFEVLSLSLSQPVPIPEILQCGWVSHASLGSPRTLIFHHQRRAATMAMLTMLHEIWPGSGSGSGSTAGSGSELQQLVPCVRGADFPFRCHVQFINIILSIFTAVQQGHSPYPSLAPSHLRTSTQLNCISHCNLLSICWRICRFACASFPHAPFPLPLSAVVFHMHRHERFFRSVYLPDWHMSVHLCVRVRMHVCLGVGVGVPTVMGVAVCAANGDVAAAIAVAFCNCNSILTIFQLCYWRDWRFDWWFVAASASTAQPALPALAMDCTVP